MYQLYKKRVNVSKNYLYTQIPQPGMVKTITNTKHSSKIRGTKSFFLAALIWCNESYSRVCSSEEN